jgi:hypothetical protein
MSAVSPWRILEEAIRLLVLQHGQTDSEETRADIQHNIEDLDVLRDRLWKAGIMKI